MTSSKPSAAFPAPSGASSEATAASPDLEDSSAPSASATAPSTPQADQADPLMGYRYVAPPSPPKQGKLRRMINGLLWAGLFAGTAVTSALIGAGATIFLPLPGLPQADSSGPGLSDLWQAGFRYQVTRPVNILVMGIDENLDAAPGSEAIFAGRTDTLLLVRVNPQDKTLRVISIPRDTRVQVPGYGMAKINYANVAGGPSLVAQTIADNLGNVQIDRYVRVNTTAFRDIVDLVGGIEIEVPQRMQYTDQTQGLYIDLYPGWQTLNGDQAEQFSRFRSDAGDIGRVQRQQILLRALRERLTSPLVIPSLPQVIRVVQRYVDTNLSLEEMLALASFGLDIDTDAFQMVMLPGRFSTPTEFEASYWIPDWEASATILQTFFQTEGVGVYADNASPRYVANLRIAVKNASESSGAGAEMVRYLRENGFSNVYLSRDAPTLSRTTEVVAQRGDRDSAEVVLSMLGQGRVLSESTGDLDSDITVRVGQDWAAQWAESPQ
ncbi:MAG: LCP family protein [Leptolyngbya sp.]|nr:LCP family protein [Leptolyngbya sp.]